MVLVSLIKPGVKPVMSPMLIEGIGAVVSAASSILTNPAGQTFAALVATHSNMIIDLFFRAKNALEISNQTRIHHTFQSKAEAKYAIKNAREILSSAANGYMINQTFQKRGDAVQPSYIEYKNPTLQINPMQEKRFQPKPRLISAESLQAEVNERLDEREAEIIAEQNSLEYIYSEICEKFFNRYQERGFELSSPHGNLLAFCYDDEQTPHKKDNKTIYYKRIVCVENSSGKVREFRQPYEIKHSWLGLGSQYKKSGYFDEADNSIYNTVDLYNNAEPTIGTLTFHRMEHRYCKDHQLQNDWAAYGSTGILCGALNVNGETQINHLPKDLYQYKHRFIVKHKSIWGNQHNRRFEYYYPDPTNPDNQSIVVSDKQEGKPIARVGRDWKIQSYLTDKIEPPFRFGPFEEWSLPVFEDEKKRVWIRMEKISLDKKRLVSDWGVFDKNGNFLFLANPKGEELPKSPQTPSDGEIATGAPQNPPPRPPDDDDDEDQCKDCNHEKQQELEKEVERLKKENEQLDKAIEDLRQDKSALRKDCEDLRKDKIDLQQDKQNLQNDKSNLEKDKGFLIKKNESLTKEIKDLKKQIAIKNVGIFSFTAKYILEKICSQTTEAGLSYIAKKISSALNSLKETPYDYGQFKSYKLDLDEHIKTNNLLPVNHPYFQASYINPQKSIIWRLDKTSGLWKGINQENGEVQNIDVITENLIKNPTEETK